MKPSFIMLLTKQVVYGPNFRTIATKTGSYCNVLKRSGRILGNMLYSETCIKKTPTVTHARVCVTKMSL